MLRIIIEKLIVAGLKFSKYQNLGMLRFEVKEDLIINCIESFIFYKYFNDNK